MEAAIEEPGNLITIRRLGPIVKSWRPATGEVDFRVDLAVVALLDRIDMLEARISTLENTMQP